MYILAKAAVLLLQLSREVFSFSSICLFSHIVFQLLLFFIRKKGFGPRETWVSLGNFPSPKDPGLLQASLDVFVKVIILHTSLGVFQIVSFLHVSLGISLEISLSLWAFLQISGVLWKHSTDLDLWRILETLELVRFQDFLIKKLALWWLATNFPWLLWLSSPCKLNKIQKPNHDSCTWPTASSETSKVQVQLEVDFQVLF